MNFNDLVIGRLKGGIKHNEQFSFNNKKNELADNLRNFFLKKDFDPDIKINEDQILLAFNFKSSTAKDAAIFFSSNSLSYNFDNSKVENFRNINGDLYSFINLFEEVYKEFKRKKLGIL